ncbi:MAG: septum formation initiator family protein [Erythrobacter sp.]
MKQGIALAVLLAITALAIAGPTGLLAWSEKSTSLEQRHGQIAVLVKERDELRNRVNLLDPENADADMVGEELRRNLNVVHPDEVVLLLPEADD